MRSAEKKRTSTCLFADEIARLSIEEYKRICPVSVLESYKQTVLSTIILENIQTQRLSVVSFGVGTKYMKHHYRDHRTKKLSDKHLHCIRDCHGEILARRGFLLYLYREMEYLLQYAIKLVQHHPTIDVRTIKTSLLEFESSSLSLKRRSEGQLKPTFLQIKLRDHIRIHLYTSSSPCGNSCIKRWAKGQTIHTLSLNSTEYPSQPHPRLHATAPHEGQVTVLTKKRSGVEVRYVTDNIDNNNNNDEDKDEDNINVPSCPRQHSISVLLSQITPSLESYNYSPPSYPPEHLPLGNAYPPPYPLSDDNPISGLSMSCSDKITTWNAVGIQGSLISHLISKPLHLTTITIGRKYSIPHVFRGLCCRVQDFQYPQSTPIYSCNHPVILCSAVKLDDGVIITALNSQTNQIATPSSSLSDGLDGSDGTLHIGANFEDPRCLCFSRHIDRQSDDQESNDDAMPHDLNESIFEIIDGDSGMLMKNSEQNNESLPVLLSSSFCSMKLYERYARCERLREELIEVLLLSEEQSSQSNTSTTTSTTSSPTIKNSCEIGNGNGNGNGNHISLDEYLLVKRIGRSALREAIDSSNEDHSLGLNLLSDGRIRSCYFEAKHHLLTSKKSWLKGWIRTTTMMKDQFLEGNVNTKISPNENDNERGVMGEEEHN